MLVDNPASLPKLHGDFVQHAVKKLAYESWLVGIAAYGSFATNTMDAFSDLDLILVVDEMSFVQVMENRTAIASSLGTLLTSFSGEHVGMNRLLECLFGPPLLHVDIIFDTLKDFAKRTGDFVILCERENLLSSLLSDRTVPDTDSKPDFQWMEDRFWVWVHKACGLMERRDLFRAIEYLTFLRTKVLIPLCLHACNHIPASVCRIEFDAPSLIDELKATLAPYSAVERFLALYACTELYRKLLPNPPYVLHRDKAESAVMAYLAELMKNAQNG